jgi:hypothetical protein
MKSPRWPHGIIPDELSPGEVQINRVDRQVPVLWPGAMAECYGGTERRGLAACEPPCHAVNSVAQRRNDGATGAKMSSAEDQAEVAARLWVGYVTILVGAYDLCTSSASTMTSAAAFESQFRSAMGILAGQQPAPRIFVSSIPDIYRLWQVLHTNPIAQQVWSRAGICPSMLAASNDEKDRQLVVDREVEFNNILAEVCGLYENCRWDGGTTYNCKFSAGQVSTLDFFQVSVARRRLRASAGPHPGGRQYDRQEPA